MEHRNELLDDWVGEPVVLSMLNPRTGVEDEEVEKNIDRMAAD